MSRRPTIHDVAAQAGVSKSLVSLAMRGSPAVAEASRAAILAAAADLGYRPNAAARSLAARASRTIGVLVHDLHNPVFAEILDGVLAGVRGRGYSTMVVTGGVDAALEESEIDKLLEFQVEGLVLVSHRLASGALRRIAAETPTTVVSRRDVRGPGIDTVCNDDRLGAHLAVQHLAGLGHRRIAHVSGGTNSVSREREQGYRDAMAEAGLPGHILVVPGSLDDAGGYTAAQVALAGPQPPTALFVANDFAAIGAMAAIVDAGLGVPGDVSVVGYDGTSLGALRSISLTSVAQPLTQMGALAAERLFARIDRPGGRAHHITVRARLVVRSSTGAAPDRVPAALGRGSGRDVAAPPVPEHRGSQHDHHAGHRGTAPDHLLHDLVGVAGQVADQTEGQPPGQAAEGVERQEPAVGHPAQPGQPGHHGAQERRPPAQEHRGPAPVTQEPPGAIQPAAVPAQGP